MSARRRSFWLQHGVSGSTRRKAAGKVQQGTQHPVHGTHEEEDFHGVDHDARIHLRRKEQKASQIVFENRYCHSLS